MTWSGIVSSKLRWSTRRDSSELNITGMTTAVANAVIEEVADRNDPKILVVLLGSFGSPLLYGGSAGGASEQG